MKCLLVLVAGGLLVLSGCGSWESSQPFPGVTPGPCDSACEAEVEAFRDDMASMPDIELADLCAAMDECFFGDLAPEADAGSADGSEPDGCMTNWDMWPAQLYAEVYDWSTNVEGMSPAEAQVFADGVVPRLVQECWDKCRDINS